MNTDKVKQIISEEIEKFRQSLPPKSRNRQYDAAKWQIEKLTELGIIDLMPAKFGHGDAGHIIKLAEDKQSAVFNAFGEGEDVPASSLNKALNEAEEDDFESVTIQLSETKPSTSSGYYGGRREGHEATIWYDEDNQSWSACFHGVSSDGTPYEGENIEDFSSKQEAIEYMKSLHKESQES